MANIIPNKSHPLSSAALAKEDLTLSMLISTLTFSALIFSVLTLSVLIFSALTFSVLIFSVLTLSVLIFSALTAHLSLLIRQIGVPNK
ncbi:MAG: hypothetical protein ACOC90_09485 [Bacteroidota bacterium]